MIIFEDDLLETKMVYTNSILIIIKEEEIICQKLFLERDEMEDYVLEYLASIGCSKNIRKEPKTFKTMFKKVIG